MHPGDNVNRGGGAEENAGLSYSDFEGSRGIASQNFITADNRPNIGDFIPFSELSTTFGDVGGNEKLLEELSLIKYTFDSSEHAQTARQRWGDNAPAGVLLFGPPGSGKTMIFKALAHDMGADLWMVMGNHILETDQPGQPEKNMARVFEIAGTLTRNTVLFFDEIDHIIRKSSPQYHVSEVQHAVTGIFKKYAEEFCAPRTGSQGPRKILLGAATNRIDWLDEAAVRSGRFDITREVRLPQSHTGHVKLWRAVLAAENRRRGRPGVFAEDVRPEKMAGQTSTGGNSMSGADIVNAIKQVGLRKAAYEVQNQGRPAPPITKEELGDALAFIRNRSLDTRGYYEH